MKYTKYIRFQFFMCNNANGYYLIISFKFHFIMLIHFNCLLSLKKFILTFSLLKNGWKVIITGIWIIIPSIIAIIVLFNGIDSSNFIPILILIPIIVFATYLLKDKILNSRKILNNVFHFYIFMFGMLVIFESVMQKEWKLSEFWPVFYFSIFMVTPVIWINYK